MSSRIVWACASVALALSAAPAQAHVVKVDHKVVGNDLVIVAYFDTDMPADDAEVVLRDVSGNEVAKGKTDDTGTWKVSKPPPGKYKLTVKAMENHSQTVPIEVEGPPATAAGQPPSESGRGWLVVAAVAISVAALVVVLWVWRKRRKVASKPLTAPE